jgi:hypothetical protein
LGSSEASTGLGALLDVGRWVDSDTGLSKSFSKNKG